MTPLVNLKLRLHWSSSIAVQRSDQAGDRKWNDVNSVFIATQRCHSSR